MGLVFTRSRRQRSKPRGSGCGGVRQANYLPPRPFQSRDSPLSPRREAAEPRPPQQRFLRGGPRSAAAAPTRVPRRGPLTAPRGAAAGLTPRTHRPAKRRLSKSYPSRRHSSNCLTEGGGRGKKKSNTQDAVGLGSPPPASPPAVRSQAKFSRKGLVLEHDNNKQSRSDSLPCWKGVHPRPSPR